VRSMEELIKKLIEDEIKNHPKSFYFRESILGIASAADPLYQELDCLIGRPQVHPKILLENAQTVIVYFLPFSAFVVKTIQQDAVISAVWSDAYFETNELLAKIGEKLCGYLGDLGIRAVCTGAPFDKRTLSADWAHKSSAVVAGIGTFGLNHLLVTKSGTAGRLGSVVTDAKIEPTKRPDHPYCLFYKTGKCKVCVEKCPSGALSEDGSFDRFRCGAYLDGKSLDKMDQGCGMCSSGPCAMRGF